MIINEYLLRDKNKYYLITSDKWHRWHKPEQINYKNDLLIHTKYECVFIKYGSPFYKEFYIQIINGNGKSISLYRSINDFKKMFMTVSEYRNLKLKSIL